MSDEKKPLFGAELNKMAAEAARRAAPVFKALDWRYHSNGQKNAGFVPDEAYLAASLAGMLERAGADEVGSTSSGRFTVARWYDPGDPVEQASIQLTLVDR